MTGATGKMDVCSKALTALISICRPGIQATFCTLKNFHQVRPHQCSTGAGRWRTLSTELGKWCTYRIFAFWYTEISMLSARLLGATTSNSAVHTKSWYFHVWRCFQWVKISMCCAQFWLAGLLGRPWAKLVLLQRLGLGTLTNLGSETSELLGHFFLGGSD